MPHLATPPRAPRLRPLLAAAARGAGRILAAPFRALARLIARERAWFAGLENETFDEWDARQW